MPEGQIMLTAAQVRALAELDIGEEGVLLTRQGEALYASTEHMSAYISPDGQTVIAAD